MNGRVSLVGFLTALLLWIGGCVPLTPRNVSLSPPTLPMLVRVVGSSDMAPYVEVLRTSGKSLGQDIDIRYVPTNSSTGLRLLAEGQAEVALVSWLPQSLPEGIVAYPVGEDDIALILHPRVGVDALSLEEVRRVFEGRYLSWAELGGAEVPVRLVSREEGSGTRVVFTHLVMEGAPVALSAIVMPSAQNVVDYVARHEGAVGYVSATLVTTEVRVVAVDKVRPGNSGYPLRRTLYVAIQVQSPQWLQEMIRRSLSRGRFLEP